jgi:hypothetical protein
MPGKMKAAQPRVTLPAFSSQYAQRHIDDEVG